MDRSTASVIKHPAAMRVARAAGLDLLLPAASGERGQSAAAPENRRVVSGASLLRQPAHGGGAARQSQTDAAPDAPAWDRSPVSEAASQPAGSRPPSLSLPAAGCSYRAAEPRLEHRYY